MTQVFGPLRTALSAAALVLLSSHAYAETAPVRPGLPDAPTPQNQNQNQNGESVPLERFSFHGQVTITPQFHPRFRSPYQGTNSLNGAAENAVSGTTTLFFGVRLNPTTELYVDPELTGGEGLSGVHGAAAFFNGDITHVSSATPTPNVARAYLVKTECLGDESERETVQDGPNQLNENRCVHRITFLVGKFALNDFFDNNSYAGDPRGQFLNLAFVNNLSWDFAADTKGYTPGVYFQLNEKAWAVRYAETMVVTSANGATYDSRVLQAHSENAEFEYRGLHLGDHPGVVRVLGYANETPAPTYANGVAALKEGETPPATSPVITTKYGFGVNAEQEITENLGAFFRSGWNNGSTQTWMFTEADRNGSAGLQYKGARYGRPDDTMGAGVSVEGLSPEHRQYLADGGYGFLLGDGKLDYGLEKVVEFYYSMKLFKKHDVFLTPDAQFMQNPGYNKDRGPVKAFAFRMHYDW